MHKYFLLEFSISIKVVLIYLVFTVKSLYACICKEKGMVVYEDSNNSPSFLIDFWAGRYFIKEVAAGFCFQEERSRTQKWYS